MVNDIGNITGTPLAAGIGGSQKLEQTKKEDQSYSFSDALAEKETQADKTEKKEMEKQDIVKTETQEEVNKKEYNKFVERQKLDVDKNTLEAKTTMASQMTAQMPVSTSSMINMQNLVASFSGNQLSNQGQVGLQELRKLMAQRGISFNRMSAQELAKLSTIHSNVEVTNFLNQLVKKMRNEDKDQNVTVSAQQILGEKMTEKDKKVNEADGKQKMDNNPDDKESENLLASAAGNVEKLQGTPLSQFFQSAKLSEFQQGSQMEQQILKQVMDKMEINTEKAKSEVAIKLNPEYLGEVKLNMKVDKDKGTVTINFKTTSREARKALEGNLSILEDAFEKAGLKLEKYEVSLEEELT